jgi:hypothetical protein
VIRVTMAPARRRGGLRLCDAVQTGADRLVTLEPDSGQEYDMHATRPILFAVGLAALGAQGTSAQDFSRYRDYALGSTLDAIVASSGARAANTRTLHLRPANIQELEWRAPYASSAATHVDPVRDILFTFFNDALYQVVVSYDPDRTEGLTNADIVESVSAVYGIPAIPTARTRAVPPPDALPDRIVLARWETSESLLTLVRGTYTPEFQLVLISKPLGTRARNAMSEAGRLDALEGPGREAAQRKKDAGDAIAARDKARATNKAAFRP